MKNESKRIVGIWHYGVILTYLSAISAVVGICISAMRLTPEWGVLCLLISGLCDTFDGMVAKSRKNRTPEDVSFGIQIDSMSDLVAFGILPVSIGFGMGMNKWYYIVLFCVYVLCALIRLSYYNVSELKRTGEESEPETRKAFEGMPVTSIAVGLPVFYLVSTMFDKHWVTCVIMAVCFLLAAILFVVRFRMPKFRIKGIAVLVAILLVILIAIVMVRYFYLNIHTLRYFVGGDCLR